MFNPFHAGFYLKKRFLFRSYCWEVGSHVSFTDFSNIKQIRLQGHCF